MFRVVYLPAKLHELDGSKRSICAARRRQPLIQCSLEMLAALRQLRSSVGLLHLGTAVSRSFWFERGCC